MATKSHPDRTPAKTQKKRTGRTQDSATKFVNVSPEEASGAKTQTKLSSKRVVADVYLSHLGLDPEDRAVVQALYTNEHITDMLFRPLSNEDQARAAAFLVGHSLDEEARENLGDRWSVRWEQTSGAKKGSTIRVLYQWYAARHES